MSAYSGFLTAVLVAAVVSFCIAALKRSGRSVKSLHGFFHSSNAGLNLIALVCATITVGTGVAYLTTSGHVNGILMALVPVGVIGGYYLLEAFISKILPPAILRYPNFLAGTHALIEETRGSRTILAWSMIAPLVTVYVLVFGFEIFASSQVIAGVVFGDNEIVHQISVAGLLFAATLIISWRGGVEAVFRADRLQFVGIVLFIAIMAAMAMYSIQSPVKQGLKINPNWLKTDLQTLTNISLAIISSVSTQFYNLMNWFAVSNLRQDAQRKHVLRATSWLFSGFVLIMVAIGAFTEVNWGAGLGPAFSQLLSPLHEHAWLAGALLAIMVIGLTSTLMSTTQGLMLSLTMFVHDNLLGKDSASDRTDAVAVHRARNLMIGLFGLGFIFLALMYYGKPDLFYLLLAIASGAEVYAPLVILIGFLARRENGLTVLSNPVLTIYLVLFASAMASNLTLSATAPKFVPYVSLAHLSLSSLISLILYVIPTRRAKKP